MASFTMRRPVEGVAERFPGRRVGQIAEFGHRRAAGPQSRCGAILAIRRPGGHGAVGKLTASGPGDRRGHVGALGLDLKPVSTVGGDLR